MPKSPLRLAIVGMGVMGRIHYRVGKFLPDIQISCLCDTQKMEGYEEPFYTNLEEMLEKERPEAAVIAVPTPFHLEASLACLKKKLPLLIEKPVAGTTAQARKILDAATSANIRVAVGHVERLNPVVRALKDELTDKEIYSITINRIGPLPPRIADVGILSDLAVHDIDLIRFISEKSFVESIVHKSQKMHNHYEDNAVLSFTLEDDILASITTNWLTPFKKRTIEVATRSAYYEANLMSQELTEYAAFLEDDEYVRSRSCHVKKGEPIQNELRAFAEFVHTGNAGNLASIQDSIFTLEVLEKA